MNSPDIKMFNFEAFELRHNPESLVANHAMALRIRTRPARLALLGVYLGLMGLVLACSGSKDVNPTPTIDAYMALRGVGDIEGTPKGDMESQVTIDTKGFYANRLTSEVKAGSWLKDRSSLAPGHELIQGMPEFYTHQGIKRPLRELVESGLAHLSFYGDVTGDGVEDFGVYFPLPNGKSAFKVIDGASAKSIFYDPDTNLRYVDLLANRSDPNFSVPGHGYQFDMGSLWVSISEGMGQDGTLKGDSYYMIYNPDTKRLERFSEVGPDNLASLEKP